MPSKNILSLNKDGNYTIKIGTSMSTPLLVSTIAMMLSQDSTLT